jgi:hypothetical protein
VVLVWPFDSIVVLAITVGVWLVVIGVFEIVSAFGIRKDANKVEYLSVADPWADRHGQQGRSTTLTRAGRQGSWREAGAGSVRVVR